MEILVLAPVGYCIGQLYTQKISRNSYLKNQNLINLSKASYKFLMRTKLSNDRLIKIDSINYDKKLNEIKKLNNQFINLYPNLSLDERIDLANNIIEIKYFDEIEKIEKDYIDKIEIVNYKIDEFYETELQMVKEDFFYYDMKKIHNRQVNFIEKLKTILLTDNIDDLINFKYNEELNLSLATIH
jgi:hypothetical protein